MRVFILIGILSLLAAPAMADEPAIEFGDRAPAATNTDSAAIVPVEVVSQTNVLVTDQNSPEKTILDSDVVVTDKVTINQKALKKLALKPTDLKNLKTVAKATRTIPVLSVGTNPIPITINPPNSAPVSGSSYTSTAGSWGNWDSQGAYGYTDVGGAFGGYR
ncbi:hypothetical protein ACFLRA_01050 [Bdellovibrionota bacterium]